MPEAATAAVPAEASTSASQPQSGSQPGRPAPGEAPAKRHGETPTKRQVVCFSFYKVLPEWRRLPAAERAEHKAAFAAVLERWNKPGEFVSITYSTIGTRGDVDFCVWTIGYAIDELNRMRSELMATPLGGYLETPHNFLAMTKRSAYQIDRADESPRAKAAAQFVPAARSTSSSTPSGRPAPGTCSRSKSASASWTSTSASASSTRA